MSDSAFRATREATVGPEVPESMTFFGAQAPTYLSHVRHSPAFAERFSVFTGWIQRLRSAFGPRPVCLDLGCGPGTLSLAASRCGFAVIGIDGSTTMLEYARHAAASSQLNVTFMQEELPLRDPLVHELAGSTQLIVASSVVEYIQDDQTFLQQCRTLLEPEGRLLISFPNRRSAYRLAERRLPPTRKRRSYLSVQQRQYSPSQVKPMMATAGLHVDAVEHFGIPSLLYSHWPSALRPTWLSTLFLVVARRC